MKIRLSMKDQIANLESRLSSRCNENARLQNELTATNKRISAIAAENESLRMDKKWLQSMHSNVLQAMIVMKGSSNDR